jgi:catechol 2,3-dioxygenase
MILTDSLRILTNELYVKDLARMKEFYVEGLGFDVVDEYENKLILGHDKTPLLELIQESDYPSFSKYGAWLYHIAYIHKSRAALSNRLIKAFEFAPESFGGSADHHVSEAFYFTDPEGNGVELYFDKDPEGWERIGGQVKMGSEYIHPASYVQTHAGNDDATFRVGHNHLQVGDLAQARRFYHEVLGLDITADLSTHGALFVSSGKYHHHFGLNIWNSQNAWVRPITQLGLGVMSLQLAQTEDLDKLEDRLTQAKIAFTKKDQTITVADPWNNTLRFSTK